MDSLGVIRTEQRPTARPSLGVGASMLAGAVDRGSAVSGKMGIRAVQDVFRERERERERRAPRRCDRPRREDAEDRQGHPARS